MTIRAAAVVSGLVTGALVGVVTGTVALLLYRVAPVVQVGPRLRALTSGGGRDDERPGWMRPAG